MLTQFMLISWASDHHCRAHCLRSLPLPLHHTHNFFKLTDPLLPHQPPSHTHPLHAHTQTPHALTHTHTLTLTHTHLFTHTLTHTHTHTCTRTLTHTSRRGAKLSWPTEYTLRRRPSHEWVDNLRSPDKSAPEVIGMGKILVQIFLCV